MTDKDLGRRLISLGLQAEALKDSEAFELAVAAVEQQIVREWASGETVGERERAHAKINVLQDIIERLDEIIGAGAIEQDKMEKEENEDG